MDGRKQRPTIALRRKTAVGVDSRYGPRVWEGLGEQRRDSGTETSNAHRFDPKLGAMVYGRPKARFRNPQVLLVESVYGDYRRTVTLAAKAPGANCPVARGEVSPIRWIVTAASRGMPQTSNAPLGPSWSWRFSSATTASPPPSRAYDVFHETTTGAFDVESDTWMVPRSIPSPQSTERAPHRAATAALSDGMEIVMSRRSWSSPQPERASETDRSPRASATRGGRSSDPAESGRGAPFRPSRWRRRSGTPPCEPEPHGREPRSSSRPPEPRCSPGRVPTADRFRAESP